MKRQPKLKFIDYSTNAEQFDVKEYLKRCIPDPILLEKKEGRVAVTYANPLLFALIYLPEKIKLAQVGFSFADFHLEVSKWAALEWTKKIDINEDPRDAFICPRGMGKSTWLIDCLIIWAACHGHQDFVALFADTPTQAQQHLSNFRETLKNNALLREDYPRVCGDGTAFKHKSGEDYINTADRQDFFRSYNGFAFTARGIDTGVLGLKVGDKRPSLIICDDIIKGSVSPAESQKRLDTFLKKIMPLPMAGGRIVVTGTSFAPGDMIHSLKRAYEDPTKAKEWIKGIDIKPHYYPPFIVREDGSKRSCWASRWSYEKLVDISMRDPSFAAAFLNEPVPDDGSYWKNNDFQYGSMGTPGNFRILSIDPAVTTGNKSDYTALTVVAYSNAKDLFQVEMSQQLKLQGLALREKILSIINMFNINQIMIETNQGGDLWINDMGLLKDIPITIIPIRYGPGESKELRAEWALTEYNKKKVFHLSKFQDLETQMLAFPNVSHDDLVDSLTTPIYQIRKNQQKNANTGPPVRQTSYVRR